MSQPVLGQAQATFKARSACDQARLSSIAAVREQVGLTDRAIRHYHAHGLVQPVRDDKGVRMFNKADIERLIVIRDLRRLGVSVPTIAIILDGRDDMRSAARREVNRQIRLIEQQLALAQDLAKRWGEY